MTIPEVTRPYFRRLAALAREHGLSKLSMGMSHDLEAAIEEGATHVRVGTALFGPRTSKCVNHANRKIVFFASAAGLHRRRGLLGCACSGPCGDWARCGRAATRRCCAVPRRQQPAARCHLSARSGTARRHRAARRGIAAFFSRLARSHGVTSRNSSTTMENGRATSRADLWESRARSAADSRYFEFPMLKRIAEASRAVIVHNPGRGAHGPAPRAQAAIFEVPHFFEPPPLAAPGTHCGFAPGWAGSRGRW